jgi:hypothetical protein
MSLIKIKVLQRLADLIGSEIKELKGQICAGPAGRDHALKFPSLAIVPGRFSFYPEQADENDYVKGRVNDVAPKTTAFNVGRWEGFIELRLGEKTPFKRYELEYKLENLFLGTTTGTDPVYRDKYYELRPGTLLIDVPECYGARCAFSIEDDVWENEMVFTNEWYSIMRIQTILPAIITRKPIHTIDTVHLSLTSDLDTAITSPSVLPSDTETKAIDQDGNITNP